MVARCAGIPHPARRRRCRHVGGGACNAFPGLPLSRAHSPAPPATMPGQGEEKERSGKRHSRLDAETLAYYAEIDGRMAELGVDDAEERSLLADNALGEAGGREAEVATDAACSRVLERLLPHASTEALCAFTQACVEGESLGAMCTRCVSGGRAAARRLRNACAHDLGSLWHCLRAARAADGVGCDSGCCSRPAAPPPAPMHAPSPRLLLLHVGARPRCALAFLRRHAAAPLDPTCWKSA